MTIDDVTLLLEYGTCLMCVWQSDDFNMCKDLLHC